MISKPEPGFRSKGQRTGTSVPLTPEQEFLLNRNPRSARTGTHVPPNPYRNPHNEPTDLPHSAEGEDSTSKETAMQREQEARELFCAIYYPSDPFGSLDSYEKSLLPKFAAETCGLDQSAVRPEMFESMDLQSYWRFEEWLMTDPERFERWHLAAEGETADE